MRLAHSSLPAWAEILLLPLVNIALAFVVVGVIVRIVGVDPFHALNLLVLGAIGSPESIGYTLYYATNFIFTGLAVALAFHGGLFNIGGEGQAYIGGLGCGLAILALDGYLPAWLMIPVAIGAAALFGAAWAAVPAWLQAWRGSHIVITTIMFNFVASALMVYLLVNVLIAPGS
ncbi:MAG: ABC transporter permease, partial [Proteobacteria bacterium]|nr:ABC transporter permease [Pseudomonadota bacterium]